MQLATDRAAVKVQIYSTKRQIADVIVQIYHNIFYAKQQGLVTEYVPTTPMLLHLTPPSQQ